MSRYPDLILRSANVCFYDSQWMIPGLSRKSKGLSDKRLTKNHSELTLCKRTIPSAQVRHMGIGIDQGHNICVALSKRERVSLEMATTKKSLCRESGPFVSRYMTSALYDEGMPCFVHQSGHVKVLFWLAVQGGKLSLVCQDCRAGIHVLL